MTRALTVYSPASYRVLFRRRGLLQALRLELGELELEYERDIESVRQFERRYRPAVGTRYEELESLRDRVNRGWAALEQAQCGAQEAESEEESPLDSGHEPRRRPAQEARQLFLALVREIHPDLAPDEAERRRRHSMMAEATLAYRDSDTRRLQWLLEHWQSDAESIQGVGLAASWSRTNRHLAWVRYRLREMRHALGQLHSSPMARLMEEHQRHRSIGRNLIVEMRRQVTAELEIARRDQRRLESALAAVPEDARAAVRAAMAA